MKLGIVRSSRSLLLELLNLSCRSPFLINRTKDLLKLGLETREGFEHLESLWFSMILILKDIGEIGFELCECSTSKEGSSIHDLGLRVRKRPLVKCKSQLELD